MILSSLRNRARTTLAVLLVLGLAACQSAPFARPDVLPPAVTVEDGSAERQALNRQVFDAATRWIGQLYYDHSLVGADWNRQVEARRPEALAQTTEAGLYRVLSELTETLDDRHTNVSSPTQRARRAAIVQGRETIGFGMGLVRNQDRYVVSRVLPESPAGEAGVRVGWRLLAVNGEPVVGQVLASETRADTLTFIDETEARRDIVMTGRRLTLKTPHEVRRRPDGVTVLRFDVFDAASRTWFDERMDEVVADPPRALVLDLRDNPGGRVDVVGAVVARLFEGRQHFMVLKRRLIDRRLYAEGRNVWTGPTAILVGPGSASGSEILSALFQETRRGPVVGERTAGAVIGSRDVNLPDGGELSVSINAVLTGMDRRLLEKVGVTPDIVVEPTLAQRRGGEDPALEAAVAALISPEPA